MTTVSLLNNMIYCVIAFTFIAGLFGFFKKSQSVPKWKAGLTIVLITILMIFGYLVLNASLRIYGIFGCFSVINTCIAELMTPVSDETYDEMGLKRPSFAKTIGLLVFDFLHWPASITTVMIAKNFPTELLQFNKK